MIVVGGFAVFALLAWGHLGVGAWIVPPPATPGQQTATAGPYRVALLRGTSQFVAGTHNTATVVLEDDAGRPIEGATVRVQPVMTTMAMDTPLAAGIAQGGGRYVVHPAFTMAGTWRLDVTIVRPGMAEQHASFDANVRWR